MHELSDDQEQQLLGELFKDKIDLLFEMVADIPHIKRRVDSIDERLTRVEYRLDAAVAAIGDHEGFLREHKEWMREHEAWKRESEKNRKEHASILRDIRREQKQDRREFSGRLTKLEKAVA